MTGATRFKEPGAFAVMRRIGDPQKVVSIINAQSCSDREHDAGSHRYSIALQNQKCFLSPLVWKQIGRIAKGEHRNDFF
jgi:hypothetical protein